MELPHRDAFASVGARLAPLTSLDEAARFFLAAAANGPHTPSRASTIAKWLGGTLSDAACMLQQMLKALTTMPHVRMEDASKVIAQRHVPNLIFEGLLRDPGEMHWNLCPHSRWCREGIRLDL